MKNLAVVCGIVRLKRQLTPYFWLNANDRRMDIPGLVEYSNLNPSESHIVYSPYYLPHEHPMFNATDERFEQKIRDTLKQINPGLADHDIVQIKISRYRFAQPVCRPNFRSMLPEIQLPAAGLFAADTSYYYPEDRSMSESIRVAGEIVTMMDAYFKKSECTVSKQN